MAVCIYLAVRGWHGVGVKFCGLSACMSPSKAPICRFAAHSARLPGIEHMIHIFHSLTIPVAICSLKAHASDIVPLVRPSTTLSHIQSYKLGLSARNSSFSFDELIRPWTLPAACLGGGIFLRSRATCRLWLVRWYYHIEQLIKARDVIQLWKTMIWTICKYGYAANTMQQWDYPVTRLPRGWSLKRR